MKMAFGIGVIWVLLAAHAAWAAQFEYRSFEAEAREQSFSGGGPSNQFPRMKGGYAGLLRPDGDLVAEYSGSFRLSVDSDRDFRGRLDIGDDSIWLSGRFTRQGDAGVLVYRRYWDDCFCFYELRLLWRVTLSLIPGTDQIEGTVENMRRGWTTRLFGYRSVGSPDGPAPFSGRYTLRLPTGASPEIAPPGQGYAAVTVSPGGNVRAVGALADGAVFSRSSSISTNGWWPFFLPLNEGRGLVIGWLRFGNPSTDEVSGELEWVRPQRPGARLYPLGYSGTVAATGSRYQAPGSGSVPLTWTDGVFGVSGGNLSVAAANEVTLLPGSRLTSNGGDLPVLTYRLNRSTGVFRGKFRHPDSGHRVRYGGILDQQADLGAGFFVSGDQAGLVRLEVSP